MHTYETIIVGAGAAGLGCARTLQEEGSNHDFLVITKDIGGRIHKTKNGQIYDGALFGLSNYKKVLAIVDFERLANPLKIRFYDKNVKSYTILSLLKNPIQLFKYLKVLRKFNKKYLAYRLRAEIIGQKKALEEDPELLRYYFQSSKDFVKGSGFETIIKKYITYVMYSFAFEPVSHLSTFDLLRYSLVALGPTHEISFDEKQAVRGFEDRIVRNEVVSFTKTKNVYIVRTESGEEFKSVNLVFATEPSVTKKLLDLPAMRIGTYVHVFSIQGKLKPIYREDSMYQAFPVGSEIIAFVRENNDTYIVASKSKNPDFGDIFSDFIVITDKYWRSAFHLKVDGTLLEADLGDRLYMIGDYNVVGIEDSYTTGIYAAKKILN